jgi:hypothetical protein
VPVRGLHSHADRQATIFRQLFSAFIFPRGSTPFREMERRPPIHTFHHRTSAWMAADPEKHSNTAWKLFLEHGIQMGLEKMDLMSEWRYVPSIFDIQVAEWRNVWKILKMSNFSGCLFDQVLAYRSSILNKKRLLISLFFWRIYFTNHNIGPRHLLRVHLDGSGPLQVLDHRPAPGMLSKYDLSKENESYLPMYI